MLNCVVLSAVFWAEVLTTCGPIYLLSKKALRAALSSMLCKLIVIRTNRIFSVLIGLLIVVTKDCSHEGESGNRNKNRILQTTGQRHANPNHGNLKLPFVYCPRCTSKHPVV